MVIVSDKLSLMISSMKWAPGLLKLTILNLLFWYSLLRNQCILVWIIPNLGSEVDRNRHVESCLSKPSTSQVNGGSESSIDVDGDGQKRLKKEEDEEEEEEEHYETYEWMGETRIRACSLVPGGYQGIYHILWFCSCIQLFCPLQSKNI